jgi:pyruvate/2-oxoglutarate dehydrogenase complex dihydrolipoamide dehydrogenase (E3) component
MTPTLPRRIFAGGETVFLKFADEAEAREVLGAYWLEPEAEE